MDSTITFTILICCKVTQLFTVEVTIAAIMAQLKFIKAAEHLRYNQRKSVKEKKNEKVIKCLQRKLAWSKYNGQGFNEEHEQY